jgi:formylglycine-generating enzyme required for sulfatase activity
LPFATGFVLFPPSGTKKQRTMRYILAILLLAAGCTSKTQLPQYATKKRPFVNTLGMKFVPVPETQVLFSIWETRVQDYDAYLKASGQAWVKPGLNRGPTYPAAYLCWVEASAFCLWLTLKERAEGKLSAEQSYRLPTDDEWSRAVGLPVEAGATPEAKSDGVKGQYPWGTEWPPPAGAGSYAVGDNKFGGIAPVGSFRPNKLGLYDLGGNLWEWCGDLYNTNSEYRVLRGGSAINNEKYMLSSSHRVRNDPSTRDDNYGFRCVLELRMTVR